MCLIVVFRGSVFRKVSTMDFVDKNVIIRTVTYHYTGQVIEQDDKWVVLDKAAWIADSGRWNEAIKSGSLNEVEPYPDGHRVYISLDAIVELTGWSHPLPRTTK